MHDIVYVYVFIYIPVVACPSEFLGFWSVSRNRSRCFRVFWHLVQCFQVMAFFSNL